jgi:arylsulfatase A-like enzyme
LNVIWVIADTLRSDAVGAYGNKKIHTPNIDAFAAKSMQFNRHYAASFPTMPARADFATGRWAMSFIEWEPLPEDQATLAQLLSAQKIETCGVVDTPFYLRAGMNYDRGFNSFYDIPGQARKESIDVHKTWRSESDRFAPRTFTKAMEWLEQNYKNNFFLYIDTWDPHQPWDAPNYYSELYWPGFDGDVVMPASGYWPEIPGYTEEKVRKAYAAYWGEVTMVDTWFGSLLRKVENMGLMEKTAIIFTTDHGFYFGEHGGLFGKTIFSRKKQYDGKSDPGLEDVAWELCLLYEEITAIPLLIYVPNVKSGAYDGLTSAVDIMPTVLEIMGLGKPAFVEGQSLLPMIKNPSTPGRQFVVTTHGFCNEGDQVRQVDDITRRMNKSDSTTLTTDEWTLLYAVEQGCSELYNLKSDPKQERNLIKENPEKAQQLHKLLVAFMKETRLLPRKLEPRLELHL